MTHTSESIEPKTAPAGFVPVEAVFICYEMISQNFTRSSRME